jgi:cytochrome c oxidase assembly protein subunit 15
VTHQAIAATLMGILIALTVLAFRDRSSHKTRNTFIPSNHS